MSLNSRLAACWPIIVLALAGLSSMTKRAAPRFVGQVIGMRFLSIVVGNNLAGQLATEYDADNLATLPALFLKIFWWGAFSGVIMFVVHGPLKRLLTAHTSRILS